MPSALAMTSPRFSAARPPLQSFAVIYCRENDCSLHQFRRAMFWQTLYPRAVFCAPFLLAGGYFAADFDLIASCGGARTLYEIDEELSLHLDHPHNGGLLRQRLKIRVSAARLRRIARKYLGRAIASADRAAILSPITETFEKK